MKIKLSHHSKAATQGLLLSILMLAAVTATAQNRVKNPSFEQPLGPDNWTVIYDDCGPFDFLVAGRTTMAHKDAVPGVWDADPPGSTNYLSKQGGHFAPNYCNGLMHAYFKQVVTGLTPGAEYNCSAWMAQYTRNENYIARSQVYMEVLGGPDLSVSRQTPYVTDNVNNNPAGWKQYALTNTASQNGEIELRLHYAFVRTIAQIWEYRNINAYYDDVDVHAVNQPPIADASATVPLVISSNCAVSALVVLDGSLSSDPDGDALHYFWYQAGDSNAFATGIVAVVTLPVGTNALALVVDDGLATNRQDFTVEVITMVEALERFQAEIRTQAVKPNPLLATLSAAAASVERCNLISAVNQLHAFQNQVRAQVAPDDPALAEQLNRAAQEFIDLLGGGHGVRSRYTRVERLDHGKVRLEFSAKSTVRHIIEASTNLVDWEPIGVASERADGMLEFIDPGAAGAPARFYRIRSLVPAEVP